MSIRDHSPIFSFDEPMQFDPNDSLIFALDDMPPYEAKPPFSWESLSDYSMSSIPFPTSPDSTSSQLESTPYLPPGDRRYGSETLRGQADMAPMTPEFSDGALYTRWLHDPETPPFPSASAPIPIPHAHGFSPAPPQSPYAAYSDSSSAFPDVAAFSPLTAYAALQPLPRSYTPEEDTIMTEALRDDAPYPKPAWAMQLWDAQPPTPGEHDEATVRRAVGARDDATVRRSPGAGAHNEATVRQRKRTETDEEEHAAEKRAESPAPLKSALKPPKLAPSAWQLYFTDWIAQHQRQSSKKLNVAQAAKEAGQEYAKLSPEQKQPYKIRSQQLKELRERELEVYMRSLTPDDIKRENAFRTAQRRAGKSRKSNLKDPNAPKKPLSAYFMFLQRIRSDPELVKEVFGDETETTKQSVLAAAKWRSMTDEERKPFLAQAEQEKLDYETARKMYEEGSPGYASSINFSILPSSPINAMPVPRGSFLRPKVESFSSVESESDGFATDDSNDPLMARA
ncbi:hypothetical protein WOLCODRAFT_143263 [Wolfiporia cocos MD-104 SS10]|uniref:HMG box domain-containing protein n=1 Tax=Wolfiporia cocos (strain MD-104) TaxID=742152 RepID=A0A2H3JG24_WOLCO|nr:hypothetical protein WOLCODRAFT_143263 [Wolfiporia cocos MD-104 SS10]